MEAVWVMEVDNEVVWEFYESGVRFVDLFEEFAEFYSYEELY
jgi:hypothetical protein